VGKNPTDRGKKGTKESVLVDADGGPLGVVIAAANVNDQKLLRETIEAIVVDRPEPTAADPQHLCLDAAYDNATGREAAAEAKYTAHIRGVGSTPGNREKVKG
jgi:putative transposase